MLTCEKCNLQFRYNSLLERHKNKKIRCDRYFNVRKTDFNELVKLLDNVEQLIYVKNKLTINNHCGYCKYTFTTKSNFTRHLKICNKKHELIEKKLTINNAMFTLYKKEYKKRNKELNKLINNKNKDIITNINDIDTTNNINTTTTTISNSNNGNNINSNNININITTLKNEENNDNDITKVKNQIININLNKS